MNRFIDENGYARKKHSSLIHRQNAYKYLYLKNREKYPLPFSAYVVHHIDGDKLNNHSRNLELLTPEAHRKVHGIPEKKDAGVSRRQLGLILIVGGLFAFSIPPLAFLLILSGLACLFHSPDKQKKDV